MLYNNKILNIPYVYLKIQLKGVKMSLTKSQISGLYVALFGRSSEGAVMKPG